MQALDTTVLVDGAGRMSAAGASRLAGHLRAVTAALDDDDTLDVRLQVGSPKRTTAQNRLLWQVYNRISDAYREGGRHFAPDTIHLYLKGAVLPLVAAEWERETGEMIEVEDFRELPNGATVRTLTTTGLTKGSFSLYLVRAQEHLIDAGLSLDLSDLLEEARGTREGGGTEPSELRTVPYDAAGNPLSDEPFVEPARAHAVDGPGPIDREPVAEAASAGPPSILDLMGHPGPVPAHAQP